MTLTRPERRLRLALRIFAGLSAAYCVGYLVPGVGGPGEADWVHPAFVVNSVAKDGLFVCVALLAASDLRRFSGLVWIVILGHVFLILTLAAMLLFGNTGEGLPALALAGWLAADVLIVAVFLPLYDRAQRAANDVRFLSTWAFSALVALGEVIVESPDERVPPREIAANVDRYLERLDARGKGTVRLALTALALYPLASLHLPFPVMAPDDRKRFLEKRIELVSRRGPFGLRRAIRRGLIRLASQMAYVGYYTDRRTHAAVGYRPFAERPEGKDAAPVAPGRLSVLRPADVRGELSADVAVIGSGAGGAIAAARLADLGKTVIVIERGRHHDPSEFTGDELEQLSKLYSDGGFQLSRDFTFQVLQGQCVGGSTVVNNGVCFDLPAHVLDRWNEDWAAGLDPAEVAAAHERVRTLLDVAPQAPGVRLNPGWRPFDAGVRALGLDAPPNDYRVVDANIQGCLGCGYCNIGCAYGRKLSMLDHVLPQAQQRHGPDAFRVLCESEAHRIERSDGRATAVVCRPRDGGEEIRVRADRVVVAGGAIASSLLLQRSGLGGRRAGVGISFNVGSPITADFDEEVRACEGLQISHVLVPPPERGFAIETWFNPSATQALVMPGWFRDHADNMRRYPHLAGAGVIVGSRRMERPVRAARFGIGADIRYKPTREELDRLLDGLRLAGEVFLEAGARRVMPSTFRFHEFRRTEELARLPGLVRDGFDISLNTAHPQGGNAISGEARRGVVDPDFRVHGTSNVFVADASVFPTSIGVNPQLAVMALADYAASRIASS